MFVETFGSYIQSFSPEIGISFLGQNLKCMHESFSVDKILFARLFLAYL